MARPSQHTLSASRNLSPYISPYKPAFVRHPSQIQIPLPLPFSATPRNTSSNSAIPSASPLTPSDHRLFTPPSQRQPSNPFQMDTLTPPSQRQPSSNSIQMALSTPPPHTPPSPNMMSRIITTSLSPLQPPPRLRDTPIRVYNDALPSSIPQPRTPADIQPRRRNEGNPFNTAPPRMHQQLPSTPTTAAGRQAVPTVTPTRGRDDVIGRRLGRRNELVENAGSVTPEQRIWRRERGSRIGIGREERERLGLGRGDTEG